MMASVIGFLFYLTGFISLNSRKKEREEEEARIQRKREREQRRKEKILERKRIEEEKQMALNVAKEERRILIAQRKLESIRLITELFERVKVSFIPCNNC